VKYVRAAIAAWVCGITIIVNLISSIGTVTTHARTFCAYNKVFVEFEEGKRVWGTMMLDSRGKPIPCSETDDTEIVTQSTTSI